jgi:hypothetical protein
LRGANTLHSIALAIPNNKENMVLCDLSKSWRVEAGEERDLLGRIIEACERFGGRSFGFKIYWR